MDLFTLIVLLVYLFAIGYLGYQGYRQTKTASDYLVAGRNANPVVMALSYGATFISTSAIVGFGGAAANFGMGVLWLTVLNIFMGIFIAFVVFGNPTRRMGHHLDAHTFPELMGKRYNSRLVQIVCALIIFSFMPLYAMAVIIGGAEFIGPVFHISYDAALYLFAVMVAAYVIAGGIKGVMLTDALQGAIMLVGMLFLLVVTYRQLGGFTAAHQALTDLAPQVPKALAAIGHQGWTCMPEFGWARPGATGTDATRFNLWWIMISTIVMGVGIGVLAQPQLIVRFMTVKSKQALNRGVAAGGVFILLMTGVAFVVGALSNVYFADREQIHCRIVSEHALLDPGADGKSPLALVTPSAAPEVLARAKAFIAYRLPDDKEDQPVNYLIKTPALSFTRGADGATDVIKPGLIAIARTVTLGTTLQGNSDTIIPRFVNSAFPKWFGVVFLMTLLSAAMSTLSSQFHTMGTAVGRDICEPFSRGNSARTIFITRCGIVIGIITAIVLGKMVRGNIIALATAIFFGICAAAFLPSFLAALFWKRMTGPAALASIVAGFVSSAFWSVFINAKTAAGLGICKALFGQPTLLSNAFSPTWSVVDPILVALPISALTAVVAAFLTKPMPTEHVAYVFGGPKQPTE
ncbi:MAG TPA: sodium:solute symporter family protein [Kiritimatiellia bacterium]|nr:sodium:solute symporter family protein [Kiritimatiellia bacterium]HPS08402.1 sodium:solute symporter family protein [Kiritimatiellia bacterium]